MFVFENLTFTDDERCSLQSAVLHLLLMNIAYNLLLWDCHGLVV